MSDYYCGYELVGSDVLVDSAEIQKRKHHKKRTNKKWLRRYGLKRIYIPKTDIFILESEKKIIGHPETLKKIIDATDKKMSLEVRGAQNGQT